MRTKRRSVLQIGAVGVGVTAAGFTLPLGQSARASDWISTSAKPARFARPLPVPQPITGRDVVEDGVTYREFVLSEQRFDGQVLDGSTTKTPLLGYAQA